jgi:hypothetical protein
MVLPHALKEYDSSNVVLIMIAHENTYGRKSSNIYRGAAHMAANQMKPAM